MAEKTTLTANLALVISLKSENTTWNALGSKTPAADFIRTIYGAQRYGPLRFFPTKAYNMPALVGTFALWLKKPRKSGVLKYISFTVI